MPEPTVREKRAIEALRALAQQAQDARAKVAERDAKILECFEDGLTQPQIADATGLTTVRVRQIVKAQRDKRAENQQREEA